MNDPESKSAADYARELKERQRLLSHDSGHKESADVHFVSFPTSEPGQFILEYDGGRRVLVEIDEATGKERFLREL
jgi:hypothetical protein